MSSQRRRRSAWSAFAGCVLLAAAPALSGPPYVTDDPEPVPLGHWELYLAATRTTDGGDRAGHVRVFLPVWLQKSFGKLTTYGGGGYWINPGQGNRNWWYAGWQAQVQATPFFSPGIEIFYQTPPQEGRSPEIHFNAGFVVDLGRSHHVLLSAGRAVHGCDCAHGFVAYLITLGPEP